MNKQKISSVKVILMGNLIVNLPVTLIIILLILLFVSFNIVFNLSLIISAIIGWIVWSKLIEMWKRWAFKRGVSPERLFYLGKIGMINFFRSKIITEDNDPESGINEDNKNR